MRMMLVSRRSQPYWLTKRVCCSNLNITKDRFEYPGQDAGNGGPCSRSLMTGVDLGRSTGIEDSSECV
jgi:hypothetical protein